MKRITILIFIVLAGAALLLSGCYGASHLKTSYLGTPGSISGTFDVVYYGARYKDDPSSVVVLDRAGDDYRILPRAPESYYRVEEGLGASEAAGKSEKFLKQHTYYNGLLYRSIYSLEGNIIGYEIRIDYELLTYPYRTPEVNYFIAEDGVVKFIVLEQSMNNSFRDIHQNSRFLRPQN